MICKKHSTGVFLATLLLFNFAMAQSDEEREEAFLQDLSKGPERWIADHVRDAAKLGPLTAGMQEALFNTINSLAADPRFEKAELCDSSASSNWEEIMGPIDRYLLAQPDEYSEQYKQWLEASPFPAIQIPVYKDRVRKGSGDKKQDIENFAALVDLCKARNEPIQMSVWTRTDMVCPSLSAELVDLNTQYPKNQSSIRKVLQATTQCWTPKEVVNYIISRVKPRFPEDGYVRSKEIHKVDDSDFAFHSNSEYAFLIVGLGLLKSEKFLPYALENDDFIMLNASLGGDLFLFVSTEAFVEYRSLGLEGDLITLCKELPDDYRENFNEAKKEFGFSCKDALAGKPQKLKRK